MGNLLCVRRKVQINLMLHFVAFRNRTIIVKIFHGTKVLRIQIRSSDQVSDLKRRLTDKLGFDADRQMLLFKSNFTFKCLLESSDRELNDGSLWFNKIRRSGAEIELRVRH